MGQRARKNAPNRLAADLERLSFDAKLASGNLRKDGYDAQQAYLGLVKR